MRLDKSLKSAVSQYSSRSNMVKALKHISNYKDATSIILTLDRKDIQFSNVTISSGNMLWLFVNTFTAADKYSPLNKDNFTQPIEIQLSQKSKTFSDSFLHFWNLD